MPDTPELPPTVHPLLDPAPACSVEQATRPSAWGEARLYSLVPNTYRAYARILHPALDLATRSHVRWREVAEQAGTVCHAVADFELLTGGQQRWDEPTLGQLPSSVAQELVALLAAHTQSGTCYLAVWEGYAHMWRHLADAHRLPQPAGRVYGCFRASIGAVLDLTNERTYLAAPNLWWPEDRAWFVATDVDDTSTYVGGSRACIAAILNSSLEAFEVAGDARIDEGADTINRGGETGAGQCGGFVV